ncbi:MAG TPA: hypothetical protein VMV37_10800 [Gammaproteobacteria bacterium]|nr:hypothetical protein [Gammaproteobacteria bacterium]
MGAEAITSLTPSERAAYDKGRSMERVVLAIQQPSVCAIVLLRARCVADFDRAFGPNPPEPLSALRAAFASGDLRPVIDKVGDINTAHVEPDRWKDDPHATWLYVAGTVSVAAPAAADDLMMQLVTSVDAADLAKHEKDAGPLESLLPAEDSKRIVRATPEPHPSGMPPVEQMGLPMDRIGPYEAALAANLETAFPSPAFPAVSYPAGVLGDLHAGVAVATMNELVDNPQLLVQPDAQEFLDQLFAYLKALGTSEDGTRLDAARAGLRPAALAELVKQRHEGKKADPFAAIMGALFGLPKPRVQIILYGTFAAQGAYNAIVQRDAALAQGMQGQVAADPAYDALVPGLAAARSALGAVKSGDWPGLNAAHAQIVRLLMAVPGPGVSR